MQHVVLVKTFPSVISAHLYEHLFYDALLQFMGSQSLIARLDYFITAKTYEPGLVYLDIELYTPQAHKVADALKKQHVNLEDSTVAIALLQLMAEDGHVLHGNTSIFKTLTELDKKSWITIEELDVLDLSEAKDHSIAVTRGEELKTANLNISLKLQPAPTRDFTPLFAAISHILLANLENSLMDTYGYYAFDETATPNKYTSVLRTSQEHHPILTDELTTCKETIEQLLRRQLVERLAQTLGHIEKNATRPDELEIYNTTHILVGKKGWQSLATEDNIRNILQNMTLELFYGKEKQQMQLSDIIETY